MLAVVGASVGATAFFALSTALKHRSARTAPDASGLEPRRLAALRPRHRPAPALPRRPGRRRGRGLALQVYALHIGALSVVQPLLTTALLFSLVLAHRVAGTRISRRELAWGAVLVVALVGFMAGLRHGPGRVARRCCRRPTGCPPCSPASSPSRSPRRAC